MSAIDYEDSIEEFKSLKKEAKEKTLLFESGLKILKKEDLSAEEVLSIKSDLGQINNEIGELHNKLDEISQYLKEILRFTQK